MKMNPFRVAAPWTRHTLAFGLSSLLFIQPALALGSPLPELPPVKTVELPEAPYPESEGLFIEILDGEGALNNIRQRTAREPIVQVEDKNHKPVAGALVLFSINTGPGGAGGSVGGLSTFSVKTGADGKAQLHGLTPNNVSGEFSITVTASAGSLVATAVIHQQNSTFAGGETSSSSSAGQASAPASSTASTVGTIVAHTHNFLVLGSIAGGVAAAGLIVGLVVTRTSGGATITAGTGTVGAPAAIFGTRR